MRLDKYASEVLGLFSRSQLEVRQLQVRLGSQLLKPSFKVLPGLHLQFSWQNPPPPQYLAEELPLNILFEDDQCLVVNKARGMVVHPANGHSTGTLVQGLLHHVQDLEDNFEDGSRPGIVHRLDKDTTGVLICAKNPTALEFLSAQFREKTTMKMYWAVVKGRFSAQEGEVEGWMGRDPKERKRFTLLSEQGGKWSHSSWRVLTTRGDYSLVELRPHTGRTHQLRVHMQSLGHPLLGDPLYARKDTRLPTAPLMLHAAFLKLILPGHLSSVGFYAPPPQDFLEVLKALDLEQPPAFRVIEIEG